MQLSTRPPIYTLPSYSLTGDLLSFLRCGLQYRYTNVGGLPASRPVQMWFGQFIHGVLEEAYRQYGASTALGLPAAPPWDAARIDDIRQRVKTRLRAQGLFAWDEELERLGDRRAEIAVNELGPELFPLIHEAEVRVTGARMLPKGRISERYQFRHADRYEMAGVIDVITHVQLHDPSLGRNRLVESILRMLPSAPPPAFEVIIDYKGMRRPPILSDRSQALSLWSVYDWQVQTYAHLRGAQEESLPVVAGVIIFLNELLPTKTDLKLLQKEIRKGCTDVIPEPDSEVAQLLVHWRDREDPPNLPLEFRLQRAIRVVPITAVSITHSLEQFDDVVARIEVCRGKELVHGGIIDAWEKNSSDGATCAACDARTFCPSYRKERAPRVPGVRR